MTATAHKANQQYFRQAYRTGQHGWETEQPSPFVLKYLKKLFSLVPDGKCLDIGCGEGRHAIAAAKSGFKVDGIDTEPLALRRARQFAQRHQAKGIRFAVADALRLPFPPVSFDLVIDYGCLHHQRKSDWLVYRANLLRVLKPGGYYVLSVFSPHFRLFHGSHRPWHIAMGAYRRYFTKNEIVNLFGNDFRIITLVEQKDDGGFWHVFMERCERQAAPP